MGAMKWSGCTPRALQVYIVFWFPQKLTQLFFLFLTPSNWSKAQSTCSLQLCNTFQKKLNKTLQISAYFIHIFVILCEKPLTPFRKCNFSGQKPCFRLFNTDSCRFLDFWVGWLAGWLDYAGRLGWAGWLGWAGLVWAQPKPQKHVKKYKKMLIPARPKQAQEILRNSIFVDPKKIRNLYFRPIFSSTMFSST